MKPFRHPQRRRARTNRVPGRKLVGHCDARLHLSSTLATDGDDELQVAQARGLGWQFSPEFPLHKADDLRLLGNVAGGLLGIPLKKAHQVILLRHRQCCWMMGTSTIEKPSVRPPCVNQKS
ncbi:hypothetical protein WJX74_006600 [Apatococcus lobatus]|uniref:Uncharacterized protein n=1 Tax=Apatococcus lobatus TaxID=904363 RepID=A0AAW1RBG6_9CHLO